MKKTLLVLALALPLLSGCRGWPEANADVVELRALHKVYRDNTVPKNPTDTAKVEALGQKIDSVFGHMEELTK